MYKRQNVDRGKSKKLFSATAQHVDRRNAMATGPNMRGGIRF